MERANRLDTCTFLWLVTDHESLSPTARRLVVDPSNEVLLSAVFTWETAVKHGLGRLILPDDPERYIPKLRRDHTIGPLPLDEESTIYLRRLPELHREPFDRILVRQAIVQGLTLLTSGGSPARHQTRVNS